MLNLAAVVIELRSEEWAGQTYPTMGRYVMKTDQVTSQSKIVQTGEGLATRAMPVVMTKIRVPRRQPGLLSRRRLVDFIHAHLDRKLILISAPAGYGKTSLLTDFAHETDLPVCWYTLDAFDRDLHTFLEHLIAAINLRFTTFGERSLALLRSMTDPSQDLYAFVATLVREIYDIIPEYFALVLDDYHAVEDQEKITEFIDLFMTYADESCHVIVASRTLPALPNLSLLLARRQASGLSIDELRFVPQEICALAQQNYHLSITVEQAERLAEYTDGWITGLLLTVAPGWEQAPDQVPIPGRINVGLYDYLSRQVLSQQPVPLRDFLLVSSVLDELNPELCTAVLGVDRPLDFIDQLRTRNLFVVEFEGGGNSLRYHDLFREFLQATLRRQDELRYMELTRRAAEAYAALGQWERAVSRYLILKNHDRIAEIIEQTAMHMYEVGRWDTLAGWIDALPPAILAAKPRCLIHRGKIYMERGAHTLAMSAYDQAHQAFVAMGDDLGTAHALVQKSSVLRFQGRYTEALAYCRTVQSLSGNASTSAKFTSALAHRNAGLCHVGLGQLEDGIDGLRQALRLYEELDGSYDIGMTHHDLGLAHELRGDLDQAAEHYQSALQQWQRLGHLGAWANTLNSIGVIHYLRGRYDQASQLFNEALAKVRHIDNPRVEAFVWASLGDLYRDTRAYELARQAYSDGLQTATRAGESFVITYTLDGLGNTCRLQGDLVHSRQRLAEALEYAKRHDSAYEIALVRDSLGILAVEEGGLKSAREHLDKAIELFSAGGYRREWARACLHRSNLDFTTGKHHSALAGLKQALRLAQQLGSDQFLVVEGQQLQPLLQYAAKKWTKDDALAHLLGRIQAYQVQLAKRPAPVVQSEPQLALRIYALGKPLVELESHAVPWPTAQSRDVFFCLLQHPRGLSREEIGAMFWPDHSPQKLDGIFRSTLYRLRRALFRESIVLESGLYRFNRQVDYWFDAQVFEGLLAQAEQISQTKEKIRLLREACGLYRGDYLDGNDADWCTLDRERLRKRYLDALDKLAALHIEQGEPHQAIEVYQQSLAYDQYRESTYRGLMLCYYQLGDRASAVRLYQTCATILRDELKLSPTPETTRLFLKIMG
jgi:LuxR family maltose regulon positive regulatory protein